VLHLPLRLGVVGESDWGEGEGTGQGGGDRGLERRPMVVAEPAATCDGGAATAMPGGRLAPMVVSAPYVEFGLGAVAGPALVRIFGVWRRSGRRGPVTSGRVADRVREAACREGGKRVKEAGGGRRGGQLEEDDVEGSRDGECILEGRSVELSAYRSASV
jgi:hypothetical protein